ncbi:MAG: aminotransferase class I/II-fold pyridoxal phosphate-dependent enzyme [Candidatus Thermoplasmatota archaeon]|nr:aminotransferase class I/II-fold pyridoxal phosphate-dependent enzyme [Candidatus Thermoplasmatota archaeon]
MLKGNKPPFSKLVIESAMEVGLYPYFIPVTGEQGHRVNINGMDTVMLGSNNYLGLTEHPEIKKAAKEAIDRYGVGCTGSRYLNGTLDIHLEMEELIADFMGAEAALMFSTGYQTNLGTLYALAGRDDYIISDSYNHASIVDGSRMSRANVMIYRHNDMSSLNDAIRQVPETAGALEVTDGVFSMEGDIAKLPDIHRICRENDVMIMVDDAHGIGVIGPKGRGTAAHFDLDVDITMGTFSKSLVSMGGFIVGKEDLIFEIKHAARSLMFSAAPPPSNVATAMKALQIIRDEPEHKEALWKNAKYLKDGLRKLGFDIGSTETPIIPVIIGEEAPTVASWRILLDKGVYTNPVVFPATPKDRNLLRNSVMATHTIDDLNFALDMYEELLEEIPINEPDE